MVDIVAHEIVLDVEFERFLIGAVFLNNALKRVFKLVLEDISISVPGAILYYKQDCLSIVFNDAIGGLYDGLENVELATFIPPYFIHP